MERSGSLDRFPNGWNDPLELYGEHLDELMLFGCNMETERNTLKELIEKYGATNSIDTVSDRDFAIEFLSASAILNASVTTCGRTYPLVHRGI